MTLALLTLVHLFATIIWVGGMFFAHQCLRPAVLASLEAPPQRLALWRAVFARFFPWVWICVIALVLTGQVIILNMGGFAAVPVQIHVMAGIGYLMASLYAYLYFVPYAALKKGVASQDWPAAGAALSRIRALVGTNLVLGLVNVAAIILLPAWLH
ncbi:MAG TPA: CopD family protein [Thiobacillaceae bacterium]|nr:CopD family protein [Thiobacillaceae bacterium]HNU64859.1 CopD family protein [Thiobacillaceae bacterium]